jgi:hypothetical protein
MVVVLLVGRNADRAGRPGACGFRADSDLILAARASKLCNFITRA